MKDTSADDKSPTTTNNAHLETSPSRVNNKDNPTEVATAAEHVVVKKGRKRLKSEDYSNSNPLQENGGSLASEVAPKPTAKRPRRAWELWSKYDKHIFFSALNLYGKDFDKIQEYFKNKMKNKQSVPLELLKNKNQIRHFYYRTWHKISVFINFNTELKTSTKELFGLINYGELWKKIGETLNDKVGAKLDELVQKGCVTIKHKGKSLRVKTPVCPVLKQIHNKSEKEEIELPTRVTIELRPRHTTDWIRVQKMAQNPNIKVTMGMQRKLASLLKCLKSKWRSREEKLLENLQSRGEGNSATQKEYDLMLLPQQGSKKNLPVILAAPIITSSQISLQKMKEESQKDSKPKMKVKLDREDSVVSETNGNTVCGEAGKDGCVTAGKEGCVTAGKDGCVTAGKDGCVTAGKDGCVTAGKEGCVTAGKEGCVIADSDNGCAAMDICDKESGDCENGAGNAITGTSRTCNDEPPSSSQEDSSNACCPEEPGPEEPDEFIPEFSDGENSHSPVPPQLPSDKDFEPRSENDDNSNGITNSTSDKDTSEVKKDIDLASNLSNLKGCDPHQGWTLDNCGEITIGEIYLMLAEHKSTSFPLDYEWKPFDHKKEEECTSETDTETKPIPTSTKSPSQKCLGVLSKLIKLSCNPPQPPPAATGKGGRGRNNSLSAASSLSPGGAGAAGVRVSTTGATSPSPTSPGINAAAAAANIKPRSSPVVSRVVSQLPVNGIRAVSTSALGLANGGGVRANGVVKQLMPEGAGDKLEGAPLAVPLDQQQQQQHLQPQQASQSQLVVEADLFRKPTAPPPPQPTLQQQQQLSAVRPAPLNSTFHQQIGQYFPKFTNRRGRQNRSRMMNNKFVGRQVLKPIQSSLMRPPTIQTINVVASTALTTTPTNNRNNSIILTPSPIILNTNGAGVAGVGGTATATLVLAPATNTTAAQLNQQATSSPTTLLPAPPLASTVIAATAIQPTTATLKSPPQISIPSPAMSPIGGTDTEIFIPVSGGGSQDEKPVIANVASLSNTDPLQLSSHLNLLPVTKLQPPRTPSPTPSLSSLMDITFPEEHGAGGEGVNGGNNMKAEPFLPMMEDDTSLLNTPIRENSPPLSSEVNLSEDISLTSAWGLPFDASPLKHAGILNHNEDSQTSIISTNSEVDRQLTAMMNENSIDFTSTFRQLAKHVTSSDKDNST